jgi:hypothetical protein
MKAESKSGPSSNLPFKFAPFARSIPPPARFPFGQTICSRINGNAGPDETARSRLRFDLRSNRERRGASG